MFAQAGSRLALAGSRVVDNTASYGGGIAAAAGAAVNAQGSGFRGNFAYERGGAIAGLEDSALSLSRTLVTRNGGGGLYGGDGGGISVQGGSAAIGASTISENTSGGTGGGVQVAYWGRLDIANSTVTGNGAGATSCGSGGGISVQAAYGSSPASRLAIANTIVAGNVSGNFGDIENPMPDDIAGTVTSSNGRNVFGTAINGDAAGDREGVDPVLIFASLDPFTDGGQLASNGGPTPTAALRDALDNPALSGAEPLAAGEVDQRGSPRPQPGFTNPDVGAFELNQDAVPRAPGPGNDVLTGTATTDSLSGLAGADLLLGRGGNDRLNGGAGGDTLRGGLGDDLLDGGVGLDTASHRDAGGAVTASPAGQASSGALGADRLLRVENLEGGRFGDRLTGNAFGNVLGGGDGADRLSGLKGDDVLRGGGGDDRLNGGRGADVLAGGAGRDALDYDALADSPPGTAGRDLVLGFAHLTDRLDLATLDARAGAAGNQAFTFLAREGAAFTGAGQVSWFQEGGDTFVEADVDADRGADFQIQLAGLRTLSAGDFVL